MFRRVTVSRTPDLLTQKTIKPEVTIASTQWQLDTEYLVNGQTELRQRLEENQQSTSDGCVKFMLQPLQCSHLLQLRTRNNKSVSNTAPCEVSFYSYKPNVQTNWSESRMIHLSILQISKSASHQKRPSALNWKRSNAKNVHWTR